MFGVVAIGYGVSGFLGYGLQTQSGINTSQIGQPIILSGQLIYSTVYYSTGGSSKTYLLQTLDGYYGFYGEQPDNSIANHTSATVIGVYLGGTNLGGACYSFPFMGGYLTTITQNGVAQTVTYNTLSTVTKCFLGLIEPSQITTATTTQTFSTHTWCGSSFPPSLCSQTSTNSNTMTTAGPWTVTNCYGQVATFTAYPPQYFCALSSTTTPIITTTVTQGGSTTTITQPACTSTITVTLTSGVPPPPLALPMNGSCYVFVYGSQNSFWQSLASILIGFTSIGIAFVVRRY